MLAGSLQTVFVTSHFPVCLLQTDFEHKLGAVQVVMVVWIGVVKFFGSHEYLVHASGFGGIAIGVATQLPVVGSQAYVLHASSCGQDFGFLETKVGGFVVVSQ